MNTGEPCETVTSTCKGEARQCVGQGPGKDMFDSTKIIATNLFNKAAVSTFLLSIYTLIHAHVIITSLNVYYYFLNSFLV